MNITSSKMFEYYKGRRVLVTGHTGFKGSWLVLWLKQLGAQVTGWSIDIPTQPSLFETADVMELCDHHFGDINNAASLTKFVSAGDFEVVFHLAAQPLVRRSFRDPLNTLATNVMGTANLLEAVRAAGRPCAVVAVTSDKCYDNTGSVWGFREIDPMGGSDPYSMSKGAAELVIASWRRSFFASPDGPIRLASARAGNVIGGGDWAIDRIITDCINALLTEQPIKIRNPYATRPWQHVLEPLSGYLTLGALLAADRRYETAFNFGPSTQDVRRVSDLVDSLIRHWGSGSWEDVSSPDQLHEATTLSLNCDKAFQSLGWLPVWHFDRTVAETASWFKALQEGTAMQSFTLSQLATYVDDARLAGVPWAQGSKEAE